MTVLAPARERFRWTILALISVSHIIGASAQYGINTLAPFYKDELGLSRAQVGLFFSAFYLAMTGASFGTGWLADRFGVRQTTWQGHFLLGICIVAAALSPSFWTACISFFLAGLGYSFLNPASTIGVMAWFRRDERATAMGIKQTGVPAGGVVAAALAPSLVLVIGWRGALAALGIVNFLFGFIFASLWRDPSDDKQDPSTAETVITEKNPLDIWRLLPLGCATGIYLIGQMVLLTYVPLYLKDVDGFFASLGESSACFDASGSDGRKDRLGRCERPHIRRPAQNRLDLDRRDVGRADRRAECAWSADRRTIYCWRFFFSPASRSSAIRACPMRSSARFPARREPAQAWA